MVFDDELDELVKEVFVFFIREVMDVFDVVFDSKYWFLVGDWVGVDYGVDGFEDIVDIFGGVMFVGVDVEVVLFGGIGEEWLGIVGCEGIEEVVEFGGDFVVEFIVRGLEGVCIYLVSDIFCGIYVV